MNVVFNTRSYAALRTLYDMFIVDGVKVVPSSIYNLLDGVALAHFIMGDGSRASSGGLYLCTDMFKVQDVVMLMNVLLIK